MTSKEIKIYDRMIKEIVNIKQKKLMNLDKSGVLHTMVPLKYVTKALNKCTKGFLKNKE